MYIDKFKKIVIKIGSSILVDEIGKPKVKWLQQFTKDIKDLIKKKKTSSNSFVRCNCYGLRISKT